MGALAVGGVVVQIGASPALLRYDWARLESLKEAFGDEFLTVVNDRLAARDVGAVARIAAIGLGIEPARLRELSPALFPIVDACIEALSLALFGGEAPKAEASEPRPFVTAAKMLARSVRLCALGCARAVRGLISGPRPRTRL